MAERMKKSKIKEISYKKERVVLSDVLPFEIPLTFSNRHFYHFLVSNKIEVESNIVQWKRGDKALDEIVRLLFDFKGTVVKQGNVACNNIHLNPKDQNAIPLSVKISHKDDDFRELSIIHPKSQLYMIKFYDKYKHLILHYCSNSPFSIRRPDKIASFVFHNDSTHKKYLSDTHEYDAVEELGKEYERLKTYFVYKRYSNIHKFYESYKYHRCEKKYNRLFKFDISKCFDSIYTHSVSWAIFNKSIVKDNIRLSLETFGGHFDTLMQNLNYGETNGIVIGPEFSRIFAELLLQQIDRRVEINLREKAKLLNKVDYEVFRYVDDYFVFFNEDSTRERVLKEFRLQLKEFKLSLNDAKTILYDKPIITEITIAKQKVSELLNECLKIEVKKEVPINSERLIDDLSNSNNVQLESASISRLCSIDIDSNRMITKFKTIIKEASVNYKDILNYTLSIVERRLAELLYVYEGLEKDKSAEKEFTKALLEILDFTFFIYSVSPRVNTTIRLCRILRKYTEFINAKSALNIDHAHLVFKKIYDNIFFILQKNKALEHTQIETLYLLIALGELGKEYWLDIDVLGQYFGIHRNSQGDYLLSSNLNYFAITVLLFYMRDKKRYKPLSDLIQIHIVDKFKKCSPDNLSKNAELVFLLFDCLTCPYLDLKFKKEILSLHGVSDSALQDKIIDKRKYWFTKWTGFDFGKELDAKISLEVY